MKREVQVDQQILVLPSLKTVRDEMEMSYYTDEVVRNRRAKEILLYKNGSDRRRRFKPRPRESQRTEEYT